MRGDIRFDVKIGAAVVRDDLNFILLRCRVHADLRAFVVVVSEEISEELHRQAVGIAAENAQTAQAASSGGLITGEDAIAGEKEAGS